MKNFFNVDNPIWKFIGNLADFFLLSVFWLICSLPIITIGASTSALYYTTLKMASNQDGYTVSSFFSSFKMNLKNGILMWCPLLLILAILGIDCYWALSLGSTVSISLLLPFFVLILATLLTARMSFVLLARCENTAKKLLLMSVPMGIKNFFPVLSTIVLSLGYYLFGIFVFWPILIVGPGLCAYINSFIFNRILKKYGLTLEETNE